MRTEFKLELGDMKDKFHGLPFAVSVSDLSEPNHPLVFVNKAFTDMTGFGEDMLGENCRFLQERTTNTDARAEIRDALNDKRKCQIVLENRRRNGELFYNLLMLEVVEGIGTNPALAIGSQFDLGTRDRHHPDDGALYSAYEGSNFLVTLATKLKIEQRRIVAHTASRMLQSWCVMRDS